MLQIERNHFFFSLKIETLSFSTATPFFIAVSIPPLKFSTPTENFQVLLNLGWGQNPYINSTTDPNPFEGPMYGLITIGLTIMRFEALIPSSLAYA